MTEPWYETAFGAVYPVLYGHRDQAEARRCLALLAELTPLGGPVLDLGCGDGRHLAFLAAAGREVVGLDLSAALLDRARSVAAGVPLLRGDMRCLPCRAASFGTVLSLFTAFGYFATQEENARPVAEIARVLAPGGSWCLDFFDADRVREELADGVPRTRLRRAGPFTVEETRSLDGAGRRVVKDVRLSPRDGQEAEGAALGCGPGGISYREEVVLFTLEELDAMADAVRMERVAAAGSYDGAALGEGDRWLLVYRKAEVGEAKS